MSISLYCHSGDIKMIKLIANITVERIENKATPTDAAPTSNTQTTPSVTVDTPTNGNSAGPTKKPTQPIDLSELRSRLQNAYRTPPPKIAVSHVMIT